MNPVRPTYLQLHHHCETERGTHVLFARLNDVDEPECFNDIEVAKCLDLDNTAKVEMFQLLTSKRSMLPFSIGLHIEVRPLLDAGEARNSMFWWQGRLNELQKEAARRKRIVERAEVLRKTRAAAGAAAPAGEPRQRRAPERHPQVPVASGDLRSVPGAEGLVPLQDAPIVVFQENGGVVPEAVHVDATATFASNDVYVDLPEFAIGDLMKHDWERHVPKDQNCDGGSA